MRLASVALALAAFVAPALAPSFAAAQTATFPQPLPRTGSPWDGLNLLLTRGRLDEIKAAYQTNDPLAVAAVSDAITVADGFLNATPDPVKGVLKVPGYYTSKKAEQQKLTAQVRGDARAAIALAWGYALTGDDRYADASKKFLDAWVKNCTKPVDGEGPAGFDKIVDVILGQTGGDTALVVHYGFPGFLYAHDILNGFGKISFAEKAAFKKWLAPFVLYKLGEERFHNNHHNWQVLFMGAAAHVTEDQHLLDSAVAYYRNGMSHQQIAADGAMWRELARKEKAATYSLMALEGMVQFVTIAKNHGVNDLRDLVGAKRKSTSTDSFLLSWVTGFHSSGVASAGGNLRAAFGAIRDFANDKNAWNRWRNTINKDMKDVNGPADASDWGWVFEVGYAWFQDPSYLALMQKAPYGLQPERTYTLSYATLLFRPFAGAASSPAPAAPAPTPVPSLAPGFFSRGGATVNPN
ncbi:MAG: alginate lyase family protein [Planctomycetota bacterium]